MISELGVRSIRVESAYTVNRVGTCTLLQLVPTSTSYVHTIVDTSVKSTVTSPRLRITTVQCTAVCGATQHIAMINHYFA